MSLSNHLSPQPYLYHCNCYCLCLRLLFCIRIITSLHINLRPSIRLLFYSSLPLSSHLSPSLLQSPSQSLSILLSPSFSLMSVDLDVLLLITICLPINLHHFLFRSSTLLLITISSSVYIRVHSYVNLQRFLCLYLFLCSNIYIPLYLYPSIYLS